MKFKQISRLLSRYKWIELNFFIRFRLWKNLYFDFKYGEHGINYSDQNIKCTGFDV